ncbi:DUF3592 domain-containing protein [Coraliomargarita parva]|uniref:DUF3592 domain-containing protein n=1 Tax=Coraliomargarita parva TaxID=3014050 RepID=UPI0022B5CA33|nr:DUF3592 domain-containing protein [Coraliomargarita parva]
MLAYGIALVVLIFAAARIGIGDKDNRIRLLIIGASLFAASWCASLAGKSQREWAATADWLNAGATIRQSEIETYTKRVGTGDNRHTETGYRFQVSYTYRVNGQDYTGQRYALGIYNSSESEIRQLAKLYPEGNPITIMYNPKAPEESAIIRGDASNAPFLYYLAGIPASFGLWTIWKNLNAARSDR